MKILVYEDPGFKDLFPLTTLRPVWDIRIGANTILQRIESMIENKYDTALHCRNSLSEYLKEVHTNKINEIVKDDILLLNGRVIFSEEALKYLLSKKEKNTLYYFNNEITAAFITKDKTGSLKERVEKNNYLLDRDFFDSLKLRKSDLNKYSGIKIIQFPWDIINYILHGGLNEDVEFYLRGRKLSKVKDRDNFINHKKIFISKKVNVFPQVVLDASEGSIIFEENTTIEPFTFIKGPVYIGKNCLIKSGTRIYGPCVIGEWSKVAGEIAESVLHSYVNKQHDGFVGHSYICPFVNLGADTVTSDLKNNYSEIRMKIGDKNINTGMQLLGSIIGDHSKTSINTMLNTGSIVGIFANLFGGGFQSKHIDSFSWNEAGEESKKLDIDKAVETARIVMNRRGIKMSNAYERLIRNLTK
ncbi:MAG: putative sugar nucleotidyl transferase [Ignavibacteria bacterium]